MNYMTHPMTYSGLLLLFVGLTQVSADTSQCYSCYKGQLAKELINNAGNFGGSPSWPDLSSVINENAQCMAPDDSVAKAQCDECLMVKLEVPGLETNIIRGCLLPQLEYLRTYATEQLNTTIDITDVLVEATLIESFNNSFFKNSNFNNNFEGNNIPDQVLHQFPYTLLRFAYKVIPGKISLQAIKCIPSAAKRYCDSKAQSTSAKESIGLLTNSGSVCYNCYKGGLAQALSNFLSNLPLDINRQIDIMLPEKEASSCLHPDDNVGTTSCDGTCMGILLQLPGGVEENLIKVCLDAGVLNKKTINQIGEDLFYHNNYENEEIRLISDLVKYQFKHILSDLSIKGSVIMGSTLQEILEKNNFFHPSELTQINDFFPEFKSYAENIASGEVGLRITTCDAASTQSNAASTQSNVDSQHYRKIFYPILACAALLFARK